MILLRADANPTIGSGHIMRCLSIAHAMRNLGAECLFASADEQARALVERQGFSYASMQTDYRHMEEELPALLPLLQQYKAGVVLTDSYFVTDAYFQGLHGCALSVYMDDLARHAYPVDVLINYNNFATEALYGALYPAETKLLLGMEYAPLRAEFQCVTPQVRETCGDLLISTGGADPLHVGVTLLDAIMEDAVLGQMWVHIIVGSLNMDAERIRALAARHSNIVIHQNVTEMAKLMQQCDLAVSASGSTLYELCACGLPTVCYTFADNQLLLAKSFAERGAMCYAGDMRENPAQVAAEAVAALTEWSGNAKQRRQVSEQMRALIDGAGACRLAEALLSLGKRQHRF